MLILAILSFVTFLVGMIFGFVTEVLGIGELPESIATIATDFFNILARGVDLFGFLIGPVGKILLSLVISLEAFHAVYKVIWFIIRKIPILNIRE